MNSNYTVLRAIATVYKIIAVLIVLVSLALVVAVIAGYNVPVAFLTSAPDQAVRIATSLVAFVVGCLIAIGLYAVGELISLLVEVAINTRNTETNTRQLVALTERQLIALQSRR